METMTSQSTSPSDAPAPDLLSTVVSWKISSKTEKIRAKRPPIFTGTQI